MGRQFGWLWAAFAVSTFGTFLAFDAFPLIAILVLDAGPAQVSLLAATGLAVGALMAIPLGPWVEFRRKRPVMVAMDLVRCCALLTVPLAYALDVLSFAQLLVSVVVGASDIAFRAASGACVKALVPAEQLLRASARFESTQWTAVVLGPPLGGLLIGVFGPVVTVVANAISFVLSALGIRAIGADEPRPARASARPDLRAGWRTIRSNPTLRPLFFNTILVNSLILAIAPLTAVLMLGELGFPPWQYALAFALPCLGGLLGARLSSRVVGRFGRERVLSGAGTLRACWSLGLAFIVPGPVGLALVIAVQFGLVLCVGVFNPVYATYRLEQTPDDQVARMIAAWSVTNNATVAATIALWGLLAAATGPRIAIAAAGIALLATPLLLRQPRVTRVRVSGAVG